MRRKIFHKDDIEDRELCAFELLAAVAGWLLRGGESSASNNAAVEKDLFLGTSLVENGFEKRKKEVVKALIPECPDRGRFVEGFCCSGLLAKRGNQKQFREKSFQMNPILYSKRDLSSQLLICLK